MTWETSPVTRNDIIELIAASKYIQLIKAYREITGSGLRFAKDEIDAASNFDGRNRTINVNAMLKVFDSLMQKSNDAKFKEAIILIMDKWEILGFESAVEAIEMVIDNFSRE